MNNNGWGDRFENDDEPDYPYKRDRLGYNTYVGTWVRPDMKLTIGHERLRRPSTGERSLTTYALFAYEHSYPRLGRVTLYNMTKLVKDNIPDDLSQWVQLRPKLGRPPESSGAMRPLHDPLAMQNTFANSLWVGFEHTTDAGLNSTNKMVFDLFKQVTKDPQDRDHRRIPRNTRRLGVINTLDYLYRIGKLSLRPRFKHEFFMDNTPYTVEKLLGEEVAERKDWRGIFSLIVRFPLLRRTVVDTGIERLIFRDFIQDEVSVQENPLGLNRGDPTGNYNETSVAFQFSTTTDYLGYRMITQTGMRLDRRTIEIFQKKGKSETNGLFFITVYGSGRE